MATQGHEVLGDLMDEGVTVPQNLLYFVGQPEDPLGGPGLKSVRSVRSQHQGDICHLDQRSGQTITIGVTEVSGPIDKTQGPHGRHGHPGAFCLWCGPGAQGKEPLNSLAAKKPCPLQLDSPGILRACQGAMVLQVLENVGHRVFYGPALHLGIGNAFLLTVTPKT
jgi:hypothetical protein